MEGDFLYDKNTSFWIGDLAYADEQHIIAKTYGAQNEDPGLTSYENKDDNLYILDTLMHIKQSMMPRTAILKQFEDRLYVNAIHGDTIYRVAGSDGLVPQYRLDMSAINGVTNFGEESMEKVMEIRKTMPTFRTIMWMERISLFLDFRCPLLHICNWLCITSIPDKTTR